MRFLRGLIIRLPDLDSLISLTSNKTQTSTIKRRSHNTRLGFQRTRLSNSIDALELVPSLPIPEAHGAVITAGEHDVVFVDGKGVNDGVLTIEVLHEVALRALPLLDGAGASGGEGEFAGVGGQSAHALLVVREHAHGFTGCEIPQADGGVEGARDDLRVGFLALDVGDGALVAGEDVDVGAGAHVPDAGYAVATTCDEEVQTGVQVEGVDAAEMAVVVADDFVGFEIPALDHFVFTAGEEVGMSGGYGQAADGGNVTRESETEGTCSQVPDLDGSVAGTTSKPFVVGLDGQTAHPTQVAGDDPHELPWRVPVGSLLFRRRGTLDETLGSVFTADAAGCWAGGLLDEGHGRAAAVHGGLGLWLDLGAFGASSGHGFGLLFGQRWGEFLHIFVFCFAPVGRGDGAIGDGRGDH